MIRRFNRFELKYLIHAAERDAIRADLAANMQPDPHGDIGTYRVTSLYYDSRDFTCFWSKLDGIKYRRKVRLRIYGADADDPTTAAMAEIKQRINRTVQKRRLRLPLGDGYELCRGTNVPGIGDRADRAAADEIRFLAGSLQLQPAVVISYQREAWMGGAYEPGLRITFDEDLGCRGPERLLGSGVPSRPFLSPSWLVMEVKADEAVPLWVTHLLARHRCQLRRISKYCAGLSTLQHSERYAELARGESWTTC
jgi:hypothetical protein